MKKCILSFLICFVFAFGLITAFGCRDEVFAYSSNLNLDSRDAFASTYCESHSSDYVGKYFNHSLVSFSGLNNEGDKIFFFYTKMFNPLSSTSDYSMYQYDLYAIAIGANDYCSCSCSLRQGEQTVFESTTSDWLYSQGSLSFSNVGRSDLGYYVSLSPFVYSINSDGKFDTKLPIFDIGDRASLDFIQSLSAQQLLDMYNGKLPDGVVDVNKSYEFSEDIGYLSNLQVVKQDYSDDQVTGAPQSHITKRVYAFSWGFESSTGVDLSNPRYILDIKARLEYKDLAFDDISIDDKPFCNTYSYKSNWNTLHDSATNCLAAYSSDNIFNREGFNTIYYFRILDTETNTCGKWLKVDINWTGLTTISSVGESGNFNESGVWVGDGNEFPLKSGMQNGDNESTLVFTDSSGKLDYSGIGDGVSSLVDGVGQVPSVISMLLSWLPNWVIVFLSVSIAIWGIMIVKKAILG